MSRTVHKPKEDRDSLKMPESQKRYIEQVRDKANQIRRDKKKKIIGKD